MQGCCSDVASPDEPAQFSRSAARRRLEELLPPEAKNPAGKKKQRAGPRSKNSPWTGVSRVQRKHRMSSRMWEAHIWDGTSAPLAGSIDSSRRKNSDSSSSKVHSARVHGRQLHLGSYVCGEVAARAYDRAAIYLRGKKANLNFPREDYLLPDEVLLQLILLPKEKFIMALRIISQQLPSELAAAQEKGLIRQPEASPVSKMMESWGYPAQEHESRDQDAATTPLPMSSLLGRRQPPEAGHHNSPNSARGIHHRLSRDEEQQNTGTALDAALITGTPPARDDINAQSPQALDFSPSFMRLWTDELQSIPSPASQPISDSMWDFVGHDSEVMGGPAPPSSSAEGALTPNEAATIIYSSKVVMVPDATNRLHFSRIRASVPGGGRHRAVKTHFSGKVVTDSVPGEQQETRVSVENRREAPYPSQVVTNAPIKRGRPVADSSSLDNATVRITHGEIFVGRPVYFPGSATRRNVATQYHQQQQAMGHMESAHTDTTCYHGRPVTSRSSQTSNATTYKGTVVQALWSQPEYRGDIIGSADASDQNSLLYHLTGISPPGSPLILTDQEIEYPSMPVPHQESAADNSGLLSGPHARGRAQHDPAASGWNGVLPNFPLQTHSSVAAMQHISAPYSNTTPPNQQRRWH